MYSALKDKGKTQENKQKYASKSWETQEIGFGKL